MLAAAAIRRTHPIADNTHSAENLAASWTVWLPGTIALCSSKDMMQRCVCCRVLRAFVLQGISVPVVQRALNQHLAKQHAEAKSSAAVRAGAAGAEAAQPAGSSSGVSAATASAAPGTPAAIRQPSAGSAATGSGAAATSTDPTDPSPTTDMQQQGMSSQQPLSSQASAQAATPAGARAAAAGTPASATDADLAAGTDGGRKNAMTSADTPSAAAASQVQLAEQQLRPSAAADAAPSSPVVAGDPAAQ